MFAVVAACIVLVVLTAGSVIVIEARVTWLMPWILGNSDAEHQCRREEGFDMHCRWDKGAGRIVETNVGKLSIEECAYKQVEEQVSVAATKYPSLILSS
jgi:hypothetical protein